MFFYRLSGLQIYQNETPTQVFFYEYWEIFRNTYFEEDLQTAAPVYSSLSVLTGKLLYAQCLFQLFQRLNCLVHSVQHLSTDLLRRKE